MKTRKRVQLICKKPSRTIQYEKDACDVNLIVKQYQKTGVLNHVKQTQGQYGDYTQVTDYQSALNSVIQAQQAFESLPASLRKRFHNNPQEFVAFTENAENNEEMVKLGLKEKVKEAKTETKPVESSSTIAGQSLEQA